MYATDETSIPVGSRSLLRRGTLFVALGLAVVLLFAACSDETKDKISEGVEDGGGGDDGGGEEPAPEEPAPEEPAPEEPAPEEPAPEDGTEDGLSSEDWLVIALLGLGALAIILVATSLASNHSQAKQGARSSLNARLGEITGGARWVHDQGSLDVLRVSDPGQLRGVWNSTRARMVDLEGNVAAFAASVGDPALGQSLNYLGQSLSGLRGALESNVGLRLDPNVAGQEQLLQNSTQSVYDRRQQLQAAMTPVTMARQ